MKEFNIKTSFHCATMSIVALPVESWDEVKEWFVKWDTLHYTLDGNEWFEQSLDSDVTDAVDWKHPASVEVCDTETGKLLDEDG